MKPQNNPANHGGTNEQPIPGAAISGSQVGGFPAMADSKQSQDWIEWSGGECPVPDLEALVEFKCRDGYGSTHPAGHLAGVTGPSKTDWWSHTETNRSRDDDIIAYRVVSA